MSVELGLIPLRELPVGAELHRIHRADRDPWFFDEGVNGRFNPVGRSGWGASYWAESPLGAWVEVFRTRIRLVDADLSSRVLTTLRLAEAASVADLSVRAALRAGVAADLVHGADYEAAQQVADGLVGQADGVRWRLRHDLEQELIGVALFGEPTGPRPAHDLKAVPLAAALCESAGREFGYEVLPKLV